MKIWMILDAWTLFKSSLIDKIYQKSTSKQKNMTNSVNKMNFLGRDSTVVVGYK